MNRTKPEEGSTRLAPTASKTRTETKGGFKGGGLNRGLCLIWNAKAVAESGPVPLIQEGGMGQVFVSHRVRFGGGGLCWPADSAENC